MTGETISGETPLTETSRLAEWITSKKKTYSKYTQKSNSYFQRVFPALLVSKSINLPKIWILVRKIKLSILLKKSVSINYSKKKEILHKYNENQCLLQKCKKAANIDVIKIKLVLRESFFREKPINVNELLCDVKIKLVLLESY